VAALFLAVIAVVLAGQWRQARPLLGRLSVPVVLAAWAPVLAGIYATFRSWRAALADLGGSLPHAGAMRVFYLGQLGKYLPGTIWPAVTQMRLGRDYRVPPRASGAAFVVFMLVLVGTGLLVGLPVVPLLGRDAVDEYRWLALVLPLFALALTPPLLNRAVAVALRAIRRPPLPAPLSLTGVLRVAGWAVLSWLCYGAHVFLLARRLGTDGGALLWLQCTGAFAAAFASGPLLLVMPATSPGAPWPCWPPAGWSGLPGLLFLQPDQADLVGQGLRGDPEDGLDPVPVVLQHPDLAAGGVVTDGHGLGPPAGVGPQALGRDLVELGRQGGQGRLQVAGRVVVDLAVHDPPLQLQPGRPPRVEGDLADGPDPVVVALQVGEGAPVVGRGGADLEHRRRPGGQAGQGHRPQRLEVELALEQAHQLAEQRQPAPVIVGAPHGRLQPGHLVGVEHADVNPPRPGQLDGRPASTPGGGRDQHPPRPSHTRNLPERRPPGQHPCRLSGAPAE
jgi:glycosyltransferase 2 family protein